MSFTKETHVSEVAVSAPATIKVFQRHGIDFCCGGHRPLSEACEEQKVDVDGLIRELEASLADTPDERNWQDAPLQDLVAEIQARFHQPLREELPRLEFMVDKVVRVHGDRYPEMLLGVQREFRALRDELLPHMEKEDQILFPAIVALERGEASPMGAWQWIDGPIEIMEDEHERAGGALANLRTLTSGYQWPADACATFQGLFYGLSQLERDMHVHIHLENNILFPRAAALAQVR